VTHAPAAARPSLVGVVLGAVVVAAATLFVYRNLYGHAFLDYDDATYVARTRWCSDASGPRSCARSCPTTSIR
jgi:hypothetical protein